MPVCVHINFQEIWATEKVGGGGGGGAISSFF